MAWIEVDYNEDNRAKRGKDLLNDIGKIVGMSQTHTITERNFGNF